MTVELYLKNSYLKECTAQVISIDGNQVVFNQTIFYPGGGGQLSDRGIIKDDMETYTVLNIKKMNGQIIHELDRPLKEHVTTVKMELDWDWRFQNMRYHTLLHVISGLTNNRYNALATSSQIERDYARLELVFPDTSTDFTSFEQIELSLKELLSQSHNVHTVIISRKEAEHKDGMIKTVMNLLPSSLNEIRIIQIEDIDEQACGGTHVRNTNEIGDFSIFKIQKKGATKRRLKVKLSI